MTCAAVRPFLVWDWREWGVGVAVTMPRGGAWWLAIGVGPFTIGLWRLPRRAQRTEPTCATHGSELL